MHSSLTVSPDIFFGWLYTVSMLSHRQRIWSEWSKKQICDLSVPSLMWIWRVAVLYICLRKQKNAQTKAVLPTPPPSTTLVPLPEYPEKIAWTGVTSKTEPPWRCWEPEPSPVRTKMVPTAEPSFQFLHPVSKAGFLVLSLHSPDPNTLVTSGFAYHLTRNTGMQVRSTGVALGIELRLSGLHSKGFYPLSIFPGSPP